jgi:membrane protein implicated in regulation of membrane protease activity
MAEMESLVEFFYGLGFWNWVFLGLALCALEAVIPGVHFLWFGLSALLVGILVMVAHAIGLSDVLTWPWQLVLFAVVSMASVFGVRRFVRPDARSDLPDLNLRGAQYIGRTAVVADAISGGRGKVRIGDTVWAATGPDMPAGSSARVTGTDDTVLIVEPARNG